MPLAWLANIMRFDLIANPSNVLVNSPDTHGLAQGFLIFLYGVFLLTHCCWAALVHFLMKLRGGIRHRLTRVACYSPLISNSILLLCMCFLDNDAQGYAFRMWLVVQTTTALVSTPLLWGRRNEEILLVGWFLNAVCLVIANCLFELRYSYGHQDWTVVGSPSTRFIASMAICSNAACLGGYGYNLVRSLARAIIMGEQGGKVLSINV